jgi:cytochrome c oxidase subunit II
MCDDRLTGRRRPDRSPVRCRPSLGVVLPALVLPALVLSSCTGIQSALDPAGSEAEAVATLFWAMVAGGGVIWLIVVGAVIYASRLKKQPMSDIGASRVIFFGGVAFPVVVLAFLLAYAVWLMPAMRPWFGGEGEGLRRIEVTAEQYWWRVRYLDSTGGVIRETANEVHMPTGERVLFLLKAKDVIHSFWIPSIGGKMDAIPGRTNSLQLQATRPGTYRGVCAEFCGTAHALMAFSVEAMEPQAFEDWLAVRPADAPAAGIATVSTGQPHGLNLFLRHGCGSCHAIEGTPADGAIGPSLTAFGARPTVAAGTLPNTPENLARFIQYPDAIKPGVRMPGFAMLPQADVSAIALYLKGLE